MGIGSVDAPRFDRPPEARREPVYRLFIASPGDLARERDAVEEVVKYINLREAGYRIEVIRWEDHSIPHWERPQDAVFLNTQFERTDLFIAMFWRRMGTPSNKRDPRTNKPYLSGTVEELDEAVQRLGEGKLKRILVYFCTRKKTARTQKEREQAKLVDEFRKKIEDEKSALYKTFTTTDRFKIALHRDLDGVLARLAGEVRDDTLASPPTPTAPPAVGLNTGEDVPRMCDRDEHDYQFYTAFTEGIDEQPGTPQVYLIYGDERQGHDSLSARFVTTIRKRIVGEHESEGIVSVPEHRVPWPGPDAHALPAAQLQDRLAGALIRKLDARMSVRERTTQALVKLDLFRRTPCVVIHHDVALVEWNAATAGLLEWYLNEYWGKITPDSARATIVVFLKLSCSGSIARASPLRLFGVAATGNTALRADLDRIVSVERPNCRRHVIDELTSVTQQDVKQWFATYQVFRSEEERIAETERLFGIGTPNEVSTLPMATVEKRLIEIHDSFTASNSERAS